MLAVFTVQTIDPLSSKNLDPGSAPSTSPKNLASASTVYVHSADLGAGATVENPGANRIILGSVRGRTGNSLAVIFPAAKVSSVAMIASRKQFQVFLGANDIQRLQPRL